MRSFSIYRFVCRVYTPYFLSQNFLHSFREQESDDEGALGGGVGGGGVGGVGDGENRDEV